MKSFVIGIAGEKNSGKDTVASMINYIFAIGITNAKYSDWICRRVSYDETYKDRIIHFGDIVKDILSMMYNIPREYFDDRKYKDELWYCFETKKFIEDSIIKNKKYSHNTITLDMLQCIDLKEILDINDNKLNCIRIRTLMQYFGTDICRNRLGDNIWVKATMSKAIDIADARKLCIVPDVRFDNEAEAIKKSSDSLYGGVIRVKRDNCEYTNHASEIIDFDCDYTIDNNQNLYGLFYKVLNIVQQIIKN